VCRLLPGSRHSTCFWRRNRRRHITGHISITRISPPSKAAHPLPRCHSSSNRPITQTVSGTMGAMSTLRQAFAKLLLSASNTGSPQPRDRAHHSGRGHHRRHRHRHQRRWQWASSSSVTGASGSEATFNTATTEATSTTSSGSTRSRICPRIEKAGLYLVRSKRSRSRVHVEKRDGFGGRERVVAVAAGTTTGKRGRVKARRPVKRHGQQQQHKGSRWQHDQAAVPTPQLPAWAKEAAAAAAAAAGEGEGGVLPAELSADSSGHGHVHGYGYGGHENRSRPQARATGHASRNYPPKVYNRYSTASGFTDAYNS
jgi:hypothetical protein